jgi:hypothetical protein
MQYIFINNSVISLISTLELLVYYLPLLSTLHTTSKLLCWVISNI